MAPETFQIAIPLSEFPWTGTCFEGFKGISLATVRPALGDLEDQLAPFEKTELFFASHWLTFDWTVGTSPSPQESVNLVLLSLWLTKPTKTHAQFRFKLNRDPESTDHGGLFRSLEQFGWIHGHVRERLTDDDLTRAARYFAVLVPLLKSHGRLHQALVLHAAGCWASQWHVKLICHAAAIEALLTYSTYPKLTRRLATSFACLTRRSTPQRNRAFLRFRDLYDTRSNIMHGRLHNVPQAKKLRHLAALEVVARDIWRTILSSPSIRTALEGSDATRKSLFTSLQTGYTPPP